MFSIFFCDNEVVQTAEDHKIDKEMFYEFHAIPMTD